MEVYRRPLNPKRPLVCIDELPHQLIAETRLPQAAQPGQRARYTCSHRQVRCDYAYQRAGVCNLFLVLAPWLGRRWTRVTAQRTYRDWAYRVRDLLDEQFPEADRLVLVRDTRSVNIHVGGGLYETFPPAEAKRLLDKLELHYTPKHGSWLNTVRAARTGGTPVRDGMAEIELSVLSRQCLARRLGTEPLLKREVSAWETVRNQPATTVDWRFTPAEARIKLKRLYPVLTDTAPAVATPSGRGPSPKPSRTVKAAKTTAQISRMTATRRHIHNRIV